LARARRAPGHGARRALAWAVGGSWCATAHAWARAALSFFLAPLSFTWSTAIGAAQSCGRAEYGGTTPRRHGPSPQHSVVRVGVYDRPCAYGWPPSRVRSHCRFRNRGTDSLSKSVIKWMSDGTKRQCDQTLPPSPSPSGSRPRYALSPPPLSGPFAGPLRHRPVVLKPVHSSSDRSPGVTSTSADRSTPL
jgi:hypothetical protein